uniref:Uncharacterized protein n=2 Tax=Picea TaxID=3328 RepID=A0A101LZG2_PICGL|nr:hypothetical protein ABT39_MTgene5174 [Picea glauca]QHR91644.1 hypothetical protein Q903MT_gene5679 [Picea sitchensis]
MTKYRERLSSSTYDLVRSASNKTLCGREESQRSLPGGLAADHLWYGNGGKRGVVGIQPCAFQRNVLKAQGVMEKRGGCLVENISCWVD